MRFSVEFLMVLGHTDSERIISRNEEDTFNIII
jgi:hypothetical protein